MTSSLITLMSKRQRSFLDKSIDTNIWFFKSIYGIFNLIVLISYIQKSGMHTVNFALCQ